MAGALSFITSDFDIECWPLGVRRLPLSISALSFHRFKRIGRKILSRFNN